MDLKNRKVAVIGLGNSGLNAAMLLHSLGAEVKATDSRNTPETQTAVMMLRGKGVAVETGGHTKGFIEGSELVVVSPGVEDLSPAIVWANELNIPIISELELGYRFCKGKIIAITGTNGKSTVTTLIGEILKNGGKDTVVCGNIGNSLCGEIPCIKEETWVVIEVSSFQLEKIIDFKPIIAVILNITDDHLDRYRVFDDYYREKLKIFANQDRNDMLILNYDASRLGELKDKALSRVLFYSKSPDIPRQVTDGVDRTSGAYTKDGGVYCLLDGKERYICGINDVRLKGAHNVENAMAASLVAMLIGVYEATIRKALKNFNGLPHRCEQVAIIDGVEYIDDSKGTTVDSTLRALESCDREVILIAGGKDKNSDYSVIKDIVKQKVKRLVLIGEASSKIKNILGNDVRTDEARDMPDAVDIARRAASDNDIILLSPMCSSFDMFKDYKERGEVFKKAVLGLKESVQKAGV